MDETACGKLAEAANRVVEAVFMLEQGAYHDPGIKPLRDAAARLHGRILSAWKRSCANRCRDVGGAR